MDFILPPILPVANIYCVIMRDLTFALIQGYHGSTLVAFQCSQNLIFNLMYSLVPNGLGEESTSIFSIFLPTTPTY